MLVVSTDVCIISNIVKSPQVVTDDGPEDLTDHAYTHVIDEGGITERMRNDEPYQEFTYNLDGRGYPWIPFLRRDTA